MLPAAREGASIFRRRAAPPSSSKTTSGVNQRLSHAHHRQSEAIA
jgi:hypothetical protein